MAYRWPTGTVFKCIHLDVEDRACPVCELAMHVCDHRYHHLWTLQGPTQVVNRLVRCPDPTCESRGQTFSPEAELSLSMPRWCMGWDVFCWLGHRRFARHWSVPQLRAELKDTYKIQLSDDATERYIGRHQTILAARQQYPARLSDAYRDIASLVLTIDGLQPEKGHETLYVVRELMRKRVWFAEPLLSSATQEVRRLIALARQWAERLDKPVRVWMSGSRMPSSRRSQPSLRASRIAIATTTFSVMWPSQCWRWTVERRSRCAVKCGDCAPSNVACWRTVVPPRPLSHHPQPSALRQMRRRRQTSPQWRRPRPV